MKHEQQTHANDFHVLVRIMTHDPSTRKEASTKLREWVQAVALSTLPYGFSFVSVYDEAQITPDEPQITPEIGE